MGTDIKQFTLYAADCRQQKSNVYYPHRLTIRGAEDLQRAAAVDHVGCALLDNYRQDANFREADVIIMDLDNDGAEPGQGMTPDDVQRAFPGVQFWAVPSKSHSKPKGSKPPQPRHHYYFPLAVKITDAGRLAGLKRKLQALFPGFDANACDASRFIYGVEHPQPLAYPGERCIDEYLQPEAVAVKPQPEPPQPGRIGAGVIPEGARNNTLSAFALSVLKRYGEGDRAEAAFRERAAACDPPLDERELSTVWQSARRGYAEKVLPRSDYLPPREYLAALLECSYKPAGDDFTDLGQSKALAAKYAGRLIYAEGLGFLVYDGSRWADCEDLRALHMVQDLADAQLLEAQSAARAAYELESEADVINAGEAKQARKRAEAYLAFARKQRADSKLRACLNQVRPLVLVDADRLDADLYLLNTPAGAVDLRTGELRPCDPADYCTKITGASPGTEGADTFAGFLDQITDGDKELARYLQTVAGMAAVGKVFSEVLVIAYGPGGNGKSTFWGLLAAVLGDYAGTLPSWALTVSPKNKAHEFAELRGKRLVIAGELEDGQRLDSAAMKQICSTDRVHAEKKFQRPFDFKPSHSVVLYTNSLPKVSACDRGTWRRLAVVPFTAEFDGRADVIKDYAGRLFESCGGAVLSWIVEGAKAFLDAGGKLEQPEAVRSATDRYREENDVIAAFIAECCETGPGFRQPPGALYTAYRIYCGNRGEWPRAAGDFSQALRAAGYETKKSNGIRRVYGLRLKGQAFSTG